MLATSCLEHSIVRGVLAIGFRNVATFEWLVQKDHQLISDYRCPIPRNRVHPGGIGIWHVDATVAALSGVAIAIRVVVRKIGSRTIVGPPPAIVKIVAAYMILHGKVDRRIRIPEV